MTKVVLLQVLLVLSVAVFSQNETSFTNSAEKLLSTDGKLTIGGYGEVHFNQALNSDTYTNGKLDVHRMVLLFGYNFSDRTQFVTELEFEHVSEVYVEQAFLQHKLNSSISFRGGLLLIPMGLTNEYHEPTTFNGVERPLVDKVIAPTTWREIGFGVTGNYLPASLKYQAYLVNGFNGYDGGGKLRGSDGLRKGRQKGAESYISSPNFTGKIEYFGIGGLNLGLSGYFGDTQSKLYDGIDKNDAAMIARADSSIVGISMLGLDARYSKSGLLVRAQYYYSSLLNTNQYNAFTGSDLGSAMTGYYIEVAFNVLRAVPKTKYELLPFLRIEGYNTHAKVDGIEKNDTHNNSVITTGLSFKLAKGAVLKTDIQFIKTAASDTWNKTLNVGIGIMF